MERASEDDQTQIRENVPPVVVVPPTSPSASVHQPAPPLAGEFDACVCVTVVKVSILN